MGIETEYGVSAPTSPSTSPMVLSGQVVASYAMSRETQGARARWDYEDENPLADARGWVVPRAGADPSQLTDIPGGAEYQDLVDDPTLANVVLTNGARLYVDHAHPEYSSPEVTNPLDAVRWDKAGEVIMHRGAQAVARTPGLAPILLYKNNTDNKGASYGTHENYLMRRDVPFGDVVRGLIPFFATRQVFCGSGKVGLGCAGEKPGFQLTQRADFFEVEVGLETTMRRPIVNTRDEPHAAAEKYRRLHVIIGDANLCEVATYLKMGTTALALFLLENGALPDISLREPVRAVHLISHDPTLRQVVELTDGRQVTALDIQEMYWQAAQDAVRDRPQDDPGGLTADTLERWGSVLSRLREDPMQCVRELDWVAKLRLLEGFRDRENLAWDHPRLALIDLQYSDVRPEKGLYHRLVARDAVDRLLTDDDINRAVTEPPHDTRAYFRGECLARYGANVVAASWDSLVFDVPGSNTYQRIPMMEPARGTKAHVSALLENSPKAEDLLRNLGG